MSEYHSGWVKMFKDCFASSTESNILINPHKEFQDLFFER